MAILFVDGRTSFASTPRAAAPFVLPGFKKFIILFGLTVKDILRMVLTA